jgi:hypothetical protein
MTRHRGAVHFVGFRGEEYASAVRAFGKPDFIHMGWDRRARREIDFDNDLIVFARGPHDQPFAERNFNDIRESPRKPQERV